MLNCHTDVVPVFEDQWHHPPFGADKLPNGDIIARGSQDMKCVGMWYLEAIRRLKSQGFKPARTTHIVFVPDEEIGGIDGMVAFIRSEVFRDLHVGFVLDEGLANEGEAFKCYYGERAPWWVKIVAKGNVGHGSQFIKGDAGSKLLKVMDTLMAFRGSEEIRLKQGINHEGRPLTLGDVTTVNMTMLNGGVQLNVVPEQLEACFDIRISPLVKLDVFRKTLQCWCQDAGCELVFIQERRVNPMTRLDENPYWQAIQRASDSLSIPLEPEIFPAATDSRFLREIGVPAVGVSAIRRTRILLHDHNEYLNEQVFLDGIEWYTRVIKGLSSVTAEADPSTLMIQ